MTTTNREMDMYTSDEIALFPTTEKPGRFDGQALATGGGWTTDGHWAVRGTCSAAAPAMSSMVASMISGELIPDGLEPVTLAARVPHSVVVTQVQSWVPCRDCGGDGEVECRECGSEITCRGCGGKGHAHGPMVDVARVTAGARWYLHPDGHEIILSDRIASALLDGRDLELFGTRAEDPVVAKHAGEPVAIIMPLRAAPAVRPEPDLPDAPAVNW